MKRIAMIWLVAAACGGADLSNAEQSLVDAGPGSGSGGSCPLVSSCNPALGGSDCDVGCCTAAHDELGQPLRDPGGSQIYQCTTPACLTDTDCEATGAICTHGATCGDNRCTCATDPEPFLDDDRDLACCPVRNLRGVCCASGQITLQGTCACPDPRMTDDGWGCACPPGLIVGDDGLCHCDDPIATYNPFSGECTCPPEMIADHDPYTGELLCVSTPIGCGDPNAHIDPSTGECVCNPGYLSGDTASGVTAQCVPIGCGDGVCSPTENCITCDFDCPCGPGPDGGVPDAGIPDAIVSFPDAGSGAPDAVISFPDAGSRPDAIIFVPDAGGGSGSGH